MAAVIQADLQAAICSRCPQTLRNSIEKASGANVDVDIINLAHQILVQEEQRVAAQLRLEQACESKQVIDLTLALDAAKNFDIDQGLIARAQSILAGVQHKELVRSRLATAINYRHHKALVSAIQEGRQCGVEEATIEQAEAVLADVETAAALEEQTKKAAEDELRQSLSFAEAGRVKSALAAATMAKVTNIDLLNEAHMVIAKAEAQLRSGLRGLEMGLQSRNIQMLQEAIAWAEGASVDDERLCEARRVVAEEEQKRRWDANLLDAMQQREVASLQYALAEAQNVGHHSDVVARASEVLEGLQHTKVVTERLEALLNSDSLSQDDLKAVLEDARTAHCAVELLNAAYSRLATLELDVPGSLPTAEADLKALLESQSLGIDELKAALDNARAGRCDLDLLNQGYSRLAHLEFEHAVSTAKTASAAEAGACAEDVAAGVSDGAETDNVMYLIDDSMPDDGDGDTEVVGVRQWQKCPSCDHLFATLQAVQTHWLQEHSGRPEVAEAKRAGVCMVAAAPEPTGSPVASTPSSGKKMRCPTCGDLFATAEEAKAHWLQEHHPQRNSQPKVSDSSSASSNSASAGLAATTVACDEHGKPTVLRKVDPETGAAHTVVVEDGEEKKFGEKTVLSMASKKEAEVGTWLSNLSTLQIRGLCHEVTQRVVEGSQRFHSKRAKLETLSCRYNLLYFGLAASASEKDLDVAYRRMAKSLHPDKHAGSEEAKERFQTMKARYEAAKKTFKSGGASAVPTQPREETSRSEGTKQEPKDEQHQAPEQTETGQECTEKDEGREAGVTSERGTAVTEDKAKPARREAYEEDEPEEADATESQQQDAFSCDFNSRTSMEEMLQNLVRQVKNIQTQEADLDKQLQQYTRAVQTAA